MKLLHTKEAQTNLIVLRGLAEVEDAEQPLVQVWSEPLS